MIEPLRAAGTFGSRPLVVLTSTAFADRYPFDGCSRRSNPLPKGHLQVDLKEFVE